MLILLLALVGHLSAEAAEASAQDESGIVRLHALVHPESQSLPIVAGDLLERELAEQAQRMYQTELAAYRTTLTPADVGELIAYLESPAASRHPLERRLQLVQARMQKRITERIEARQDELKRVSAQSRADAAELRIKLQDLEPHPTPSNLAKP